jgi:outer membrane murein-binding lipoprotein Lpp
VKEEFKSPTIIKRRCPHPAGQARGGSMGTINEDLARFMRKLEQERDELRLKVQLGKAEARAEWERFEQQWNQLRGKSDQIKNAVDETAREIGAAAMRTAREIQRGYERIRSRLR